MKTPLGLTREENSSNRDMALAHAESSLRTLLARLAHLDVLVVGNWAMAPLTDTERRDFPETAEDGYQTRSTILASQPPVTKWLECVSSAHLRPV